MLDRQHSLLLVCLVVLYAQSLAFHIGLGSTVHRHRSVHQAQQDEVPLEALEAEYWATLNETERRVQICTLTGLECLKAGALERAVSSFDEAQELSGGDRYLWQRGVALFYLDRYVEAAHDLETNAAYYEHRFEEPATEERILALAARRLAGEKASASDSALKEVRPVLRVINHLFQGLASPNDLANFVTEGPDPLRRLLFSHFYCGLYFEAFAADTDRAAAHMLLAQRRANAEPSHKQSSDLILTLPELHLRSRGWDRHNIPDNLLSQASAFAY